jgi:acyl carrier protein
MGLDLLDITFRIEKTFGFSFSRDELAAIVRDHDIRVGDLYGEILKKLHLRDIGRHDFRMNLGLWLVIQNVVHSVTRTPLNGVELQTRLEILFPRKTRRTDWAAIREACPYRIRELDYPRSVRAAGFLLAVSMAVVEQFQLWQLLRARWIWPVLGALGIWMIIETYAKVLAFLAPMRTAFPSGIMTVKDLCRAVLAANYDAVCQDSEVCVDQRSLEVWRQLTTILADAIGVDADRVTFRSRLYRDLGAE